MNPTDRLYAIPKLPTVGGMANVPGLRRLWLVEARHVVGVLDPRTVANATAGGWHLPDLGLDLTEDAILHDWRFPTDWGSYEEKQQVGVQGCWYAHQIKLSLPRDTPLMTLTMQRMAGRKWLAFLTDGNAQLRLVGMPKQPLRFDQALSLRPNGRVLTWMGETRQPALYLTTPDEDLLSAYQAYQYDFSIP